MNIFDVNKEKGGRWYVCNIDYPKIAMPGSYCKEKKDALRIAAKYMDMPFKDYLKWRKERLAKENN